MKRLGQKAISAFFCVLLVCSMVLTSFGTDYSCYRGNLGYRVVSVNGNLNIRKGPGTNYASVRTVSTGSIVYVDRYQGNWGHISTGSLDGYWISANTSYTIPAYWERLVLKTTANLNLRKGPSSSTASIKVIPKNTVVYGWYRTSGWSYVEYGGTRGWVSNSYVTRG